MRKIATYVPEKKLGKCRCVDVFREGEGYVVVASMRHDDGDVVRLSGRFDEIGGVLGFLDEVAELEGTDFVRRDDCTCDVMERQRVAIGNGMRAVKDSYDNMVRCDNDGNYAGMRVHAQELAQEAIRVLADVTAAAVKAEQRHRGES